VGRAPSKYAYPDAHETCGITSQVKRDETQSRRAQSSPFKARSEGRAENAADGRGGEEGVEGVSENEDEDEGRALAGLPEPDNRLIDLLEVDGVRGREANRFQRAPVSREGEGELGTRGESDNGWSWLCAGTSVLALPALSNKGSCGILTQLSSSETPSVRGLTSVICASLVVSTAAGRDASFRMCSIAAACSDATCGVSLPGGGRRSVGEGKAPSRT